MRTAKPTVDAEALLVAEVFGPTWQGEGPSLGSRAGFIRLGLCNLDCRWCDTPYTWDWARFDKDVELRRSGVAELAARVEALDVPLLVVTGGEPLMQQRALTGLLRALPGGLRVEVETNGTIRPQPGLVELVDQFNVSPKLANSGVRQAKRRRYPVLEAYRHTGKAVYKFVATSVDDLAEVDEIVTAGGLAPVYVMAEGTSARVVVERTRELADAVLAKGWNLTTRLHVLVWGDRRGV
jgi:7-carboxy-7-deazaguanine synthase